MFKRIILSTLFLFLLSSFFIPRSFAGTCHYPSFSDTTSHAADTKEPNVGDDCNIPGTTDGAHYQYGSGACFFDFNPSSTCKQVPRCGFLGSGFCCDPKPGTKPAPPPPSGIHPTPSASNIEKERR